MEAWNTEAVMDIESFLYSSYAKTRRFFKEGKRGRKRLCSRVSCHPRDHRLDIPRSVLEEKELIVSEEEVKSILARNEDQTPDCECRGAVERECSSFYTNIGAGEDLAEVRRDFEQRLGLKTPELRLEKAVLCKKEGKSESGCPIAKQVRPAV